MKAKILFVDDEPNVLEAYQRNLRKRYNIEAATSGQRALELMAECGPFAVIVADMQMPVMNGVEFLVQAQQRAPDSVRLMLTGNADQHTASEAVNRGHVYRFLNKPCLPELMAAALDNAVRQYELVTAERELLEKTLNGSIDMLTGIMASVDPFSFGRGEQLRDYMASFARARNLAQTWELELAAMLSRIGYVTVPPKLMDKLRRGQELTAAETDVLTRVPEIGAHLLSNIPRLESVANIILYQNKNYDGSGFPRDSLLGEEIPLGARVLRVLANLAELESSGLAKADALKKMQTETGRYDPQVLDSTFACFDVSLASPTPKSGNKSISLRQLAIGDVLCANVETKDGTLILCSGTKVSQMVLQKLRNFEQVQGVREPLHIQASTT